MLCLQLSCFVAGREVGGGEGVSEGGQITRRVSCELPLRSNTRTQQAYQHCNHLATDQVQRVAPRDRFYHRLHFVSKTSPKQRESLFNQEGKLAEASIVGRLIIIETGYSILFVPS